MDVHGYLPFGYNFDEKYRMRCLGFRVWGSGSRVQGVRVPFSNRNKKKLGDITWLWLGLFLPDMWKGRLRIGGCRI